MQSSNSEIVDGWKVVGGKERQPTYAIRDQGKCWLAAMVAVGEDGSVRVLQPLGSFREGCDAALAAAQAAVDRRDTPATTPVFGQPLKKGRGKR